MLALCEDIGSSQVHSLKQRTVLESFLRYVCLCVPVLCLCEMVQLFDMEWRTFCVVALIVAALGLECAKIYFAST